MEESDARSPDKQQEERNAASYLKLTKLVAAMRLGVRATACVAEILTTDGDINYAIPSVKQPTSGEFTCRPGTVLHQCTISTPVETFKLLLRHGADIVKVNSEGQTALHALLRDSQPEFDNPMLHAYLSAHVSQAISENPGDKTSGISHFHVACLVDHSSAVEFFLANDVDVNQAIDGTSWLFPGCTPLHLAAVERASLEVTRKLLQHGADVRRKDVEGLTPLCALARKTMILVATTAPTHQKIQMNQLLIRELLASANDSSTESDEHGFSNFHAACIVGDVSLAESLLAHVKDIDRAISEQSPFCPGYTALHFAAHFNVDLVKFLLEKKANLLARDVSGVTPLDVCAQRHSIEDVLDILSRQPSLKDTTFSDGKTKLLDLLRAMQSMDEYASLLQDDSRDMNCRLAEDSPVWPGYTPLHFLVLFYDQIESLRDVICALQEFNVDFSVRDARGSSPLHLAARRRTSDVATDLLRCCPQADTLDENDASHLLVACAAENDGKSHLTRMMTFQRAAFDAVLNLASRSSVQLFRRTFPAKTTPLHLLVATNKPVTAKDFIKLGADLNATDEAGWTPVHRLMLLSSPEKMAQALFAFKSKLEERVVEGVGLSHLHVACYAGSLPAVELLLIQGSDVNATIKCGTRSDEGCQLLRKVYDGCTPLHVALLKGSYVIAGILLEAGADIFARNAANISPLCQLMLDGKSSAKYLLMKRFLQNSDDLQTGLRATSEMTMLHFYAFTMDLEEVEKLIDAGADVNAKLQADSPVWPGCTPLHAWVYGARNPEQAASNVSGVLKALLDAGADVTIPDSHLDTPLHTMIHLEWTGDKFDLSNVKMLMKFNLNPVNANGLSHFHLAVHTGEITAVERFLENGVDVNQRVDALSNVAAGCTSLHLLGYRDSYPLRVMMAELLLRYGADLHARDICGNTPLHHTLVKCPLQRKELFKLFVAAGADIHATNFDGQTLFEASFREFRGFEQVEFYLQQGYRVHNFNVFHHTGLLATALLKTVTNWESRIWGLFDLLLKDTTEIKKIDEAGRTSIHNLVSITPPPDYTRLRMILEFLYRQYVHRITLMGCDVNAQDCKGKTALHMAAQFKNFGAVRALLGSGVDVNLVDADGITAFEYALSACCRESHAVHGNDGCCALAMAGYLEKMLRTGLHISKKNRDSLEEALHTRSLKNEESELPYFLKCLEEAKDSMPFKIHNLLSETNAVTAYPTMPYARRSAIDKFYASDIDSMECDKDFRGMLKLQYDKLLKRASMIPSAHSALRVLSGMPLPELICEELLRYISYDDTKNLVAVIDSL